MSETPEEKPTEPPTGEPTEPPKEEPTEKPEIWYCIDHGPVEPRVAEGRKFCPICNKLLSKKPYEREEPEGEEGEEEARAITPPEVETIQQARGFIRGRLKEVYGVGKSGKVVMRALTDDPSPMRDGTLLHAFIKALSPKANDQQLSVMVIKPLYAQFPTLSTDVDQYLRSMQPQAQPPFYWLSPPYQGYQGPYQHLYPTQPGQVAPQSIGYPYSYPPRYPYGNPYVPLPYQPPQGSTKIYKIVVNEQEIETDEAGFRAWTKYLEDRKREKAEEKRQQEEHETQMRKLDEEIKHISGSGEKLVKVKLGEEEIEVPASIAPLYLKGESNEVENLRQKLEDEREERHKAEIGRLEEKIDNRATLQDQLKFLETYGPLIGLQRGGRTTLDVLDSIRSDVQATATQIMGRLPSPGGEFKPEVSRTPEERKRRAGEIQKRLRKSEEVLEAEDQLIRSASRVS